MQTTLAVLEELGLADIPRITVYNKSDLLDPRRGRLLVRGDPDSVLLAATDRESTRGLIEKIASMLAARWDASAKVPAAPPVAEEEPAPSGDSAEEGADEGEVNTLESMLAAGGKRSRGAARKS